jgi:integrase
MATIRKRSGSWTAEVRIKGQPRTVKTFSTKGEAKLWADETELKLRKGGSITRETLEWLIDAYKEAKELDNYQEKVLTWWSDRLGTVKLSDLKKADFLEGRRALQKINKARGEGTIAPATVNRRMAAISAVLSYGIEELCLLETNPAHVTSIEENNARDRLLTDDERTALLAACKAHDEPSLYPLVRTAMITGARAGELLALRWSDVDFDNGVVRITKNTRRDTTKNSDSRPVPIAGEALKLLKARRKVRRIDNDLVFYNQHTGGVYNYRQHWAKVKEKAGITDFKFHDLRHQAASELAMAGVPLMQIGALLGHRSAQMTKRYSHYSQEAIRGLGDILSDRIG